MDSCFRMLLVLWCALWAGCVGGPISDFPASGGGNEKPIGDDSSAPPDEPGAGGRVDGGTPPDGEGHDGAPSTDADAGAGPGSDQGCDGDGGVAGDGGVLSAGDGGPVMLDDGGNPLRATDADAGSDGAVGLGKRDGC